MVYMVYSWYTMVYMVYLHGIMVYLYGIHGRKTRKTVKNIKMAAFGGKLQVSEKHKVPAFFPKRFGLDYDRIII
jgi:hypothetical protein